MAVHTKPLTDANVRRLPIPERGETLTVCPATPGFSVRVTSHGARSWVFERRVDGRTTRRTLGSVEAMSVDAARRARLDVGAQLEAGRDPMLAKREKRDNLRDASMTFEAALLDYVDRKRRKDGKPLKARTIADYKAMAAPSHVSKFGHATLPGMLYPIAGKSLSRLTGDDLRRLHKALAARGPRQQGYAAQVARAVLGWHGIVLPGGDPFAESTPDAKRISIAPTKGDPRVIPLDQLGRWYKAACKITTATADALRFSLLTGARPGEVAGLRVGDVDIKRRTVVLADPKNRKRFVIYLSEQAAVIAHWHADGQEKDKPLFGVVDGQKTLDRICREAGVERITPHDLRASFATVADGIVTAAVCRAMLNHAHADVAEKHYIRVDEKRLRDAWQAVGDFVESAK